MLLHLLDEIGLFTKKTANTSGGEYHSPCPSCGGFDRFCIWPYSTPKGRYWCRRCNVKGDAIQFCRDFMGLTYQQSCEKLNLSSESCRADIAYSRVTKGFTPKITKHPTEEWQTRGDSLVEKSSNNLLGDQEAVQYLAERNLTLTTAKTFHLGWNSTDWFESKSNWGIQTEGRSSKQYIPKGLIIPVFNNQASTQKIKIRRAAWKNGDDFPKYWELSGGSSTFSIFGNLDKPFLIVEAEIDAILVQQEAGDLCCSVALGGVTKKPTFELDSLFMKSKILYSLDFDQAGKNVYGFWRNRYPGLIPWPSPFGKSPEDALKSGVNLREWLKAGLDYQISSHL